MSNVLIVDDKDFIRNVMSIMIKRIFSDVSVKSVSSGKTAVKEVEENKYDLIFLDINLGESGTEGIDALEKIKEINPSQKIYMMTGYPIDEIVRKKIEGLSQGVLKKPI